ncbi:MAG: TetR/AcrR family transcriptional regulator, partial [Candidatus Tectomicrobia bacterium]|nr:TetR/AcrR family transcriptional regulator [Candidatus Tectomicrobia bacterium]
SMRKAKQAVLRTFMETTIAQAAKEVFAESGYGRATLDEIAQRAGMAKATIYIYYKNKDDLFLQVVEELVNQAIAETAQEAETSKPPLEKLCRIVRGKLAFYEREREFVRIYLNEKQGLEVAPKDPHKQVLREMYLQGIEVLEQVLQEGMDTGVLRPMDSRRLAFFLQEMMSCVLVQRVQGKASTSWEEDAEQLLDLFLHGAQPLKPLGGYPPAC